MVAPEAKGRVSCTSSQPSSSPPSPHKGRGESQHTYGAGKGTTPHTLRPVTKGPRRREDPVGGGNWRHYTLILEVLGDFTRSIRSRVQQTRAKLSQPHLVTDSGKGNTVASCQEKKPRWEHYTGSGRFSPPNFNLFSSHLRYVDAYRSVAVQMGAAADLKNVISKSGMKTNFLASPGTGPGEPNDEMYLKQAEHLMKRSIYPAAVAYLDQAIHLNPHSKVRSLLLSFLRVTKIPFSFSALPCRPLSRPEPSAS